MPNVDLHCHSSASDGLLPPAEVVRRAADNRVDLLALTDHDDLGGLSSARAVALEAGIRFINGVEVSIEWGGLQVHILGYNFAADDPGLPAAIAAARDSFIAAMDDDLGISAALAAVFELVRDVNRRIAMWTLSTADAGRALDALRDLDQVLGVLPDTGEPALDADLAELLDRRAAARGARDWAASDRLRDELAASGIAVEDSRDGQRWRRLETPSGA